MNQGVNQANSAMKGMNEGINQANKGIQEMIQGINEAVLVQTFFEDIKK
ncbi:hypothetical protein ABE083_04065 [Bacillus mycoides]|nr:hypothetical protein [Bacillus mycoides]